MAAASPGKDYGASFFENSSEKRKYFLKKIHSDRGATRGILLVESSAGNYYNYTSGAGDGEPNEQSKQDERNCKRERGCRRRRQGAGAWNSRQHAPLGRDRSFGASFPIIAVAPSTEIVNPRSRSWRSEARIFVACGQQRVLSSTGPRAFMRFLPAARIVVLDADRDHRAFICASLGELGLLQVLPAATLPEAREIAEKQPIDLCVVDPRGFEALARAEGKKVIANPFRQDAIPAVLLSADTSRAMIAAATEAGYRAVVGLPVVPRFLYRRIGSILQKTRRAGRSAVEEARAGSNAPGFSESRRQRN